MRHTTRFSNSNEAL